MRIFLNRIVGIALIIAAVGGLIFSLVGLAWIWTFKPDLTANIQGNLRLAGNALDTTAQGLVVADQSLTTSIVSITTMEGTVEATAKTINDTRPMVDTLVVLTKDELPITVSSAKTSLIAAQESARIIDSVLTALTSIPFVSRDIYNPPVPLHVALEQVSSSLDKLPSALNTIQESLTSTGNNMETIHADIDLMAADIHKISESLSDAQSVVKQYQQVVTDLQVRVERVDSNLPRQINLLAWVLTFILIWTAIAQLGLLMQGWGLLQSYVQQPAYEVETVSQDSL